MFDIHPSNNTPTLRNEIKIIRNSVSPVCCQCSTSTRPTAYPPWGMNKKKKKKCIACMLSMFDIHLRKILSNDFRTKMGSDVSHFNVLLIVQGQSHETVSINHNFWRERWAKAGNRTWVLPLLTSSSPSLYRHPLPPPASSTAIPKSSLSFQLTVEQEMSICRIRKRESIDIWIPYLSITQFAHLRGSEQSLKVNWDWIFLLTAWFWTVINNQLRLDRFTSQAGVVQVAVIIFPTWCTVFPRWSSL